MVTAPLRGPIAPGLKLTLMAQVALGASWLGQLLVCVKSPLARMLPRLRLALFWLFLREALRLRLVLPTTTPPKSSAAGESVTRETPVPASVTVCGLLAALWLMVSRPAWTPMAGGVKVTSRVQLCDGPTAAPQLLL